MLISPAKTAYCPLGPMLIATVVVFLLAGCGEDDPVKPDPRYIINAFLTLEEGAWTTANDTVVVSVSADRATHFMLGNSPGFAGSRWHPLDSSTVDWVLTTGEGEKTVYAKFTGSGTVEDVVVEKRILLDTIPPQISMVVPTPVNGAAGIDRPPLVSWTPAKDTGSGVSGYRVYCDTVPTAMTLALTDSTNAGRIWGLNSLSSYHWRVEAVDHAGNSSLSTPWVFTTSGVPECGVLITAGTFSMGSPPSEMARQEDEDLHTVQLTRDFYITRYEVTAGQYVAVLQWAYDRGLVIVDEDLGAVLDNMGGYPQELIRIDYIYQILQFDNGRFSTRYPDIPVRTVSWYGAAAYCDWLSLREGLAPAFDHTDWSCNGGDVYAASGYRLPTESEWEFAARAGATTAFYNGPMTDNHKDPLLDAIAWYSNHQFRGLPPVGLLEPNDWGLYDILGNVSEWVLDRYGEYPVGTPQNPAVDPVSLTGRTRIARGGSTIETAWMCRLAFRSERPAGLTIPGFRVVRTVP